MKYISIAIVSLFIAGCGGGGGSSESGTNERQKTLHIKAPANLLKIVHLPHFELSSTLQYTIETPATKGVRMVLCAAPHGFHQYSTQKMDREAYE